MKRKKFLPDTRITMDALFLDKHVTRTEPNAMLLVDSRRKMVVLRFRETRDIYDLTEFHLNEDGMSVTCTFADYTRLLFWLREEHNTIMKEKGK